MVAEKEDSWACRTPQLETLRALLSLSGGRAVFVCGGSSTGKRTIVQRAVPDKAELVTVDCVVQHTERLLFSAIAGQNVSADVGELVRELRDSPRASTPTVVVLERAERLCGSRSLSPSSLAALLELPKLARTAHLSLVFLSRLPWPRFRDSASLDSAAPPCVHFAPYAPTECVAALRALYVAPSIDIGVSRATTDRLYPGFVTLVVNLLSAVTTDIRDLQNISREMFPRYLAPLRADGASATASGKNMSVSLFNTVTAELRGVLQSMYRREFVVRDGKLVGKHAAIEAEHHIAPQGQADAEIDADLSVVAKFLLLAAYLAGRNPAKHDMRYFTTERTRKPYKRAKKAGQKAVGQAFSLERLLAIFEALRDAHRVDGNPESTLSTNGQVQIANLLRLGFLTSDTSGDPLSDPKYRAHISLAQAELLSRILQVELHHYLHVD